MSIFECYVCIGAALATLLVLGVTARTLYCLYRKGEGPYEYWLVALALGALFMFFLWPASILLLVNKDRFN